MDLLKIINALNSLTKEEIQNLNNTSGFRLYNKTQSQAGLLPYAISEEYAKRITKNFQNRMGYGDIIEPMETCSIYFSEEILLSLIADLDNYQTDPPKSRGFRAYLSQYDKFDNDGKPNPNNGKLSIVFRAVLGDDDVRYENLIQRSVNPNFTLDLGYNVGEPCPSVCDPNVDTGDFPDYK